MSFVGVEHTPTMAMEWQASCPSEAHHYIALDDNQMHSDNNKHSRGTCTSRSYDVSTPYFQGERRSSISSRGIFRPFEDCLSEEDVSSSPSRYSSSYAPPNSMPYNNASYMKASSYAYVESPGLRRFAPYRHELIKEEADSCARSTWASGSQDTRMGNAHYGPQSSMSGSTSQPIAIPSQTSGSTKPIMIPERQSYDEFGAGSYTTDADQQRGFGSMRGPYSYDQQMEMHHTPAPSFSNSYCPPSFAGHHMPRNTPFGAAHVFPTYPTPPLSQSPTGYIQPGTMPASKSPTPAPFMGTSVPSRRTSTDWDMAQSLPASNSGFTSELSLLTKREMHNLLERKRRDGLRDCFSSLVDLLPNITLEEGCIIPAKITVLQVATDHVRELKAINAQASVQLATLRHENAALRARLNALQGH